MLFGRVQDTAFALGGVLARYLGLRWEEMGVQSFPPHGLLKHATELCYKGIRGLSMRCLYSDISDGPIGNEAAETCCRTRHVLVGRFVIVSTSPGRGSIRERATDCSWRKMCSCSGVLRPTNQRTRATARRHGHPLNSFMGAEVSQK